MFSAIPMVKILSGFVLLLASGAMLPGGEPPEIPMVSGIRIDGERNDPAWQTVRPEPLTATADAPDNATTTVRIGRDSEKLYLLFDCREHHVGKIRTRFDHGEERDSAIDSDDCVEILLRSSVANTTYRFVINSAGIVYDALNRAASYNADIVCVGKVDRDGWTLEAAIPFADLGGAPQGGEIWQLALGRRRYAGQHTPTLYALPGHGDIADESRFVARRPVAPDHAAVPLKIESISGDAQSARITLRLAPGLSGRYLLKLTALDRESRKLNTTEQTVAGSELRPITIAVSASQPPTTVELTVSEAQPHGKICYQNRYELTPEATSERRTARPDKPLFTELLSTEAKTQFPFSGLAWSHGLPGGGEAMDRFALRFGIGWDSESATRAFAATGMARLVVGFQNADRIHADGFLEKYQQPLVFYPRIPDTEISRYCVIEPELRKMYLEQVRRIAAAGKLVKGLYLSDELSEIIETHLIREFQKHPRHPGLKTLDLAIRKNYGNGLYGIPAKLTEKNPAALIAYRRFLCDELVKLYTEAYQLAKSIQPDIVVFSDDPSSRQSKIHDFADWSKFSDIATHQMMPKSRAAVDNIGFLTKRLTDISGMKNIWPCVHIEEYMVSYTPEEVRDELSAAVRCGATGFHCYMADTAGARRGKKFLISERFGAPDRYALQVAAAQFLAKSPQVAFPQSDVLLFTATDSLRAQPGMGFKQPPDADMFLHGFLAKGCGVWYHAVNERTLARAIAEKRGQLLFSAENEFIASKTLALLTEYVKNGATLVLLNANAFTFRPDGSRHEAAQTELTGVTVDGPLRGVRNIRFDAWTLPVTGMTTWQLRPLPGTVTAARFDDGSPALTVKALGRGKVMLLAGNPGVNPLAGNPAWTTFFRHLAATSGARLDQDIWRLQLPGHLLPPPEAATDARCLTGNAVRWQHFQAQTDVNTAVDGSYSLVPAPNSIGDHAAGEIPFAVGKLTDRLRAIAAPTKTSNANWVIQYSRATPFAITVNLSRPCRITALKFWVRDHWRDATVQIGDRKFRISAREMDSLARPESVRELVWNLPEPTVGTRIEIRLDAAPGGQSLLTIGEMELWGTVDRGI